MSSIEIVGILSSELDIAAVSRLAGRPLFARFGMFQPLPQDGKPVMQDVESKEPQADTVRPSGNNERSSPR